MNYIRLRAFAEEALSLSLPCVINLRIFLEIIVESAHVLDMSPLCNKTCTTNILTGSPLCKTVVD
jgi:hypothetical protein